MPPVRMVTHAAVTISTLAAALFTGCIGSNDAGTGQKSGKSNSGPATTNPTRSSDAFRRFSLDALPVATITIGEHEFKTWLATSSAQQNEGLMFVPEDEIADDQGMLFVFDREATRSFWMRNTVTSLDIAYARANGRIVTIHTMPPLTDRFFVSAEPAQFALEVKAGTFAELGIKEGDKLVIPPDVFKTSP